jgi:hypothetical protein
LGVRLFVCFISNFFFNFLLCSSGLFLFVSSFAQFFSLTFYLLLFWLSTVSRIPSYHNKLHHIRSMMTDVQRRTALLRKTSSALDENLRAKEQQKAAERARSVLKSGQVIKPISKTVNEPKLQILPEPTPEVNLD